MALHPIVWRAHTTNFRPAQTCAPVHRPWVLTPTATTFGEKFVEAVTSGWRGFVDGAEDLILVVVYLWPVVLIMLAILLVARPALKRRKARRAEKKQAKLAAKAAAQAQPAEPAKPDDTVK